MIASSARCPLPMFCECLTRTLHGTPMHIMPAALEYRQRLGAASGGQCKLVELQVRETNLCPIHFRRLIGSVMPKSCSCVSLSVELLTLIIACSGTKRTLHMCVALALRSRVFNESQALAQSECLCRRIKCSSEVDWTMTTSWSCMLMT